MNPIRIFFGAIAAIITVAVFFLSGKIYETVDADEFVVIQSPVAGTLSWYTTPGLKWQGFGEPTHYKQRSMYDFTEKGYQVRFNDGGHGTIFGSIQYELPSSEAALNALHRKYKTMERVEHDLVEPASNAALYLVGTLMSSKESYSEKRNDLIHYVTDQIENGIYRTRQKTDWVKDQITGETKQITSAEIILDKDGNPLRQEISPLKTFGIRVFNFTIKNLPYDAIVEKQIQQQQQITMDVQTSVAEAKKAEQRALTAEQQGKANATEAKWKQETIKATEIAKAEQEKQVATIVADRERQVQLTNAQRDKDVAETRASQNLAVAELDKQAAEQTKQKDILLGEGEATRKKLVLEADGALEQKLKAYETVNATWANALRNSKLVPDMVFGGQQGQQGSQALDLINLLTAKTAQDLSLQMGIASQPKAAGR